MAEFFDRLLLPRLALLSIATLSGNLGAKADNSLPELIEQLGSDQFQQRQSAMSQLRRAKLKDVSQIARAAFGDDDLEIADRCWTLIRELKASSSEEQSRLLRRQLQSIAGNDERRTRQIEKLFRKPEPHRFDKGKPIVMLPRAPLPAPVPLTPAEKAKREKREALDRVIKGIDQQMRRMQTTSDAAPAADRQRYSNAIKKLKQQRERVQKLKALIK